MPEEQLGHVNPEAASGGGLPMATPDVGGGVGQALEQGAEVASKIHADQLNTYNTVQVMDAHNKLQDFNQSALFDPKTGVLNQNLGKDAPKAVDETMKAHDAAVDKIASGLTNDAQRIQFMRVAQENRHQIQQHLDGYETRQVNQYADGVAQATMKNAAMSASQNAVMASVDPANADPARRASAVNDSAGRSIELGIAALKDNFKRQNPTAPDNDPRLQEQISAYQSAAHYGVITGLLAQGNDLDAKAYYDTNKGRLEGTQRDDATLKVQAGSTAGEAVRRAPQLVYDGEGNLRSREDVYADMRKDSALQGNPRLLAATESQVNRLFSQEDEAKRERQQATLKDAYELMKAKPAGFGDPAVQAKIQDLPPEQQEWLRAAGIRDQKAAAKGVEIPDNSPAYVAYLAKATTAEGRAQIANEDPSQYRGQVSERDFDRMVTTWEHARGKLAFGSAEEDGSPAGILTPIEQANNILEANGFKKLDPSGKVNADWTDFLAKYNQAVSAGGGPKKLGVAGMQKLGDDLMAQTVQNGQPGKRVFQSMPKGGGFAFNAAQMSRDDRMRAIGLLQARGVLNPTDTMIYQTYLGTLPNAAH